MLTASPGAEVVIVEMWDILKDFALVDRREYLPYCPVCGSFFQTAAEICILGCKHFFCGNCVSYFSGQVGYICPFDGLESGRNSGKFMGEAVDFLANWVVEVKENPQMQDEIVDRLLADIPMVRKNLNFKGTPCRIRASGVVCKETFLCPCDHDLVNYRKKQCPYQACGNQDCMFDHGFRSIPKQEESGKAGLDAAIQPFPLNRIVMPQSVQLVANSPRAIELRDQTAVPNVGEEERSGCCGLL